MKLETFALSLALIFFLPRASHAKTLEFPKDEPRFAVTFPDDWSAELTKSGIISSQPKGAAYAITIFPVAAKTASGAINETKTEVDKRFQNVEPGTTKEFQNKNNI